MTDSIDLTTFITLSIVLWTIYAIVAHQQSDFGGFNRKGKK